MSLPGFTAEASLQELSLEGISPEMRQHHHYVTSYGTEGLAGLAVIPQQFGCICRCFTIPFLGRRCYRCCLFPPGCRRVSSC